MTVYTVEQARDWFLNNAGGSVQCSSPSYGLKVCRSYPEAESFFNGYTYSDSDDSREDDSSSLISSSLIGMAVGAAMSSVFSSDDSSPDTTPDVTPDTSSFDSGGGDFGGAGAGSDF